ncbi:hypothetical protein LSAT2_029128 [Lamellibrachia satsuma]|nr:hypothetical protein LSAT2_029128 [Lamellibrachia satsuma]
MQKAVTEKRSEIDSLHSKIHWLEECMEAAGKHEHILQEDNQKLATTLKRASKQSEKLQAELHDNQCRTRQLHDKINKLEASLEKAVTKSALMQEKLEHQEQDLARTKLKHQLELKELARNGHMNKSSHRSKASNKSLSVSPVQPTDSRAKSSHAKVEQPVSSKPFEEQIQNIASQNAVGEELRQLLEEMKSLIYGQQLQQQASKQMPQAHNEKTTSGRHSSRGGTSSGYRSATDPDQLLSDLDLYMNLRQDSSRLKQAAEGSMPPERDNSVSSVSDFVGSKSTVYEPEWSPNCPPVKDDTPGYSRSCRRVKKKPQPLGEDATVLCERLEKKIAGLSKLGGQLQHENKKITRMMRDQDKKLKKVKGQITK